MFDRHFLGTHHLNEKMAMEFDFILLTKFFLLFVNKLLLMGRYFIDINIIYFNKTFFFIYLY